MTSFKFNVLLGDMIVARDMSLEVAMILVEGMFGKYYLENNLKISIQKVQDDDKNI